MRLKKAIEKTLKDWVERAETGSEGTRSRCALCEYQIQHAEVGEKGCLHCSYYITFGHCCEKGQPLKRWWHATTKEENKQYAKEIVNQLEQLREVEND